eukprot:3903033-Rhodomonas_salina.1
MPSLHVSCTTVEAIWSASSAAPTGEYPGTRVPGYTGADVHGYPGRNSYPVPTWVGIPTRVPGPGTRVPGCPVPGAQDKLTSRPRFPPCPGRPETVKVNGIPKNRCHGPPER